MYFALKCESLGPFDALFLLDDPDNISNIVACCILEKYEFNEMKNFLLKKLDKLHKCKSKLVKILGLWWFKEMEDNEWIAKQEFVIEQKKGIQTKEQLLRFMADEHSTRVPYDNVQYKFFCIPDYEEGKGVIVLKCHHVFADGMAIATFMLYIFGEYDPKNIPCLKPLSIGKKLLIMLATPFLTIINNFKIMCTTRNENAIKRN